MWDLPAQPKTEPQPAVAQLPRIGVTIATPLRYFPSDPKEQVAFLAKNLPQIGRVLRELHDHPFYSFEFVAAVGGICKARNSCVGEFLKTDDKWLLWWDDDLYPDDPSAAVLRLLSHKQPIVGALYCRRAKKPVYACTFMPAAELQTNPLAEGLLQVVELGGGFTLIHRKVYEELHRLFVTDVKEGGQTIQYVERESGEAITGFYQQRVYDRDFPPEDYFFNYLCRCAKIGILVDTKLKIPHRNSDGTMYPTDWPAVPGVD